jgi:hypothetical protein
VAASGERNSFGQASPLGMEFAREPAGDGGTEAVSRELAGDWEAGWEGLRRASSRRSLRAAGSSTCAGEGDDISASATRDEWR